MGEIDFESNAHKQHSCYAKCSDNAGFSETFVCHFIAPVLIAIYSP